MKYKNWAEMMDALKPETNEDVLNLVGNPIVVNILNVLRSHGNSFLKQYESQLRTGSPKALMLPEDEEEEEDEPISEEKIKESLNVAKTVVGVLFGNQSETLKHDLEKIDKDGMHKELALLADMHNTCNITTSLARCWRVTAFLSLLETAKEIIDNTEVVIEGETEVPEDVLAWTLDDLSAVFYSGVTMGIIPLKVFKDSIPSRKLQVSEQQKYNEAKEFIESCLEIYRKKETEDDFSVADMIIEQMLEEEKKRKDSEN